MSAVVNNNEAPKEPGMNKVLLIVAMLLMCFGVAVVYTASIPRAVANGFAAEHYLLGHLAKVSLGLVLMLFFGRVWDYAHWRVFGRLLFFASAIATLATLMTSKVNGANRGIFGLQPSEFLKLGVIIYVSWKLAQAGDNIKTVACSVVQPGIPFLITVVLLAKQPNYSMMILISFVLICVMLSAGVNLKYMGIGALAAIPVVIVLLVRSEHSRARLMSFFGLGGTMEASNWQGEHALQALGNGGFTGTGFGMGVQKLGYLPEAHKDVVYAVIGEEFGLMGTMLVLILFAVLFAQGFKIAKESSTRFGKYLALGLTLSLFANFAIHLGVCVGLLPMTGQPLPFFSYGGTNLIYTSIAIGILLNISRPKSGRKIKEPMTSGVSMESSAYRNYDMTRSG